MITECVVTTRKIPSLCYGLPFIFLFSGASLKSGTQRNVLFISSSSKDGPVNVLGKSEKVVCSKANL